MAATPWYKWRALTPLLPPELPEYCSLDDYHPSDPKWTPCQRCKDIIHRHRAQQALSIKVDGLPAAQGEKGSSQRKQQNKNTLAFDKAPETANQAPKLKADTLLASHGAIVSSSSEQQKGAILTLNQIPKIPMAPLPDPHIRSEPYSTPATTVGQRQEQVAWSASRQDQHSLTVAEDTEMISRGDRSVTEYSGTPHSAPRDYIQNPSDERYRFLGGKADEPLGAISQDAASKSADYQNVSNTLPLKYNCSCCNQPFYFKEHMRYHLRSHEAGSRDHEDDEKLEGMRVSRRAFEAVGRESDFASFTVCRGLKENGIRIGCGNVFSSADILLWHLHVSPACKAELTESW